MTTCLKRALQCMVPLVVLFAFESSSLAQNWPNWRGPLQSGVAPRGNPPVEWSESENVKWKLDLPGEGLATPVVWGDTMFVLSAIDTGNAQAVAAKAPAAQKSAPKKAPTSGSVFTLGQRVWITAGVANDEPISTEVLVGTWLKWFEGVADGETKVSEDQFRKNFGAVMVGEMKSTSDRRAALAGRFVARKLFGAFDADGNKNLTKQEIQKVVTKWASGWDSKSTGRLTKEQVLIGLETALPKPPPSRGGFGGGLGGGTPTTVYKFLVTAIDRHTGKKLWEKTPHQEIPHEGHHPDGTFASPSPVTDGELLFAYFGSRGLFCYDLDGNLKWSKQLGQMRIANRFGEGSSPALTAKAVIVNWDNEGDSFIVAFDKKTGNELWRKSRSERTSWSTPLVVEAAGKTQVIVTATGKVRSYDADNGDVIWSCSGMTSNVIPTAVSDGKVVYCISGFRGAALLALRLDRTGDLTDTDAVLWSQGRGTPYVPSPVLTNDRLYFFSGNNAILSCVDTKTGEVLIDRSRIGAIRGVYASPVASGGKIYLVGREGVSLVIKDSPSLEVLATNRLSDRFDASPAVVGDDLYLRGRKSLYCISVAN